MNSDAINNVFIYGTLKRDFCNHDEYLKFEKYLGEYRTKDCYPLVIAYEWFAPVLLLEPGVGQQVLGELYCVDDTKLTDLDRFEHTYHAKGYKRVVIDIQNVRSEEYVEAFAYMNDRRNLLDISSDYFSENTDRRYIPKDKR